MNDVEYIIGSENILKIPMETYSDEICAFINSISSELIGAPESRIYKDISALAFWGRKGNIQKLKTNFCNNKSKIGRGVCFHVAPSNIPINFAFSYFFSLLAGNANIVRLPSKKFPQVDFLCHIFGKILQNYPNIKDRTAFVRYPANDAITETFSKIADARMIWGGDQTIASIRQLETKPRCVDIAFADRYSICIINAEKILEANDEAITKLSENFYNDTYSMDQNACSSPQLILWVNDSVNARNKFWQKVYDIASKKYELQDAISVDKYVKACEDAINLEDSKTKRMGNILYRTELKALTAGMESLRGKGGYFYEYNLKDYDELYKVINEKYQTVTYFGIDAEKLRKEIIQNNLLGIDRICPIGKAMDINVIWDGHDLVNELSREIEIA